jgi:hypothetical protein
MGVYAMVQTHQCMNLTKFGSSNGSGEKEIKEKEMIYLCIVEADFHLVCA